MTNSSVQTPSQDGAGRSVAVIAYIFPPVASIGHKRPLRFVNHLARHGFDVTVYAAHPGSARFYHSIDHGLAGLVNKGVRVVRTSSLQMFERVIEVRDRFRRMRGGDQHTGSDSAPTPNSPRLFSQCADAIMGRMRMPDQYVGWMFPTLPRMVLNFMIHRPCAIYVTAPPWTAMVVASMAGRILKIPVHLDYRDPWSLNPYLNEADTRHRVLENWVLSTSATITVSTESMAKLFSNEFTSVKNKIHCVYNAFDRQDIEAIERLRSLHPNHRRETFVVSHVGTLYSQRMPIELARSLAHIAARWNGGRDIRFRFVGPLFDHGALSAAFGEQNVSGKLEIVGTVTSEQAKIEQLHADVLLLLQSGTQLQLPAKLFEYALTGNPVLCIADKGSELSRVFEKYRLGEVIDGEPAQIDASINLLFNHSHGHPRKVPESFLRDFDEEELAQRMRAIIGL